MVYLQTKNYEFGTCLRAFKWKTLVYLWLMGPFYGHLVYFMAFGTFYGRLVYFPTLRYIVPKYNLATLVQTRAHICR
jgi:hypothetical protein